MPPVTLHLISLSRKASISSFLGALNAHNVTPLVTSKVVRWIIQPKTLSVSTLLDTQWDLLVILPVDTKLPDVYMSKDWVNKHWSITAGVPGRLVKNFHETNNRLLHPRDEDVPPLSGSMDNPRMTSSTQGLELNKELLEWSKKFTLGQNGAVSMLNLLAFKPGKEMHDSYLRYGKAFAESIGKRRGGTAKLVGRVLPNSGTDDEDKAGWDEIALAHYPSINHFVDMLASEDYQEVNHRDRLPSLRDTCILCTTELDPELMAERNRARL